MEPARTAVMPRRVVIGLDVGTTGVKAVAFAPDSPWRSIAIREYPLLQPAPRQFVQDPDTLRAAAAGALGECVSATGGAEVIAVSVSAGMHGLMALDEQRRPLTPLITWADARATEEARDLRRSGRAEDLHERTGVPVHPMSPLTKLLWFRHHEPDVWRAARWWIGLKDFVLLWLTGSVVTELSSASGTGLIEMSTRTWSAAALGACGVAPERLPPIVSPTKVLTIAPRTAMEVGLPAGTPVIAGAADGPLGNLGTGATSTGVAGLTLGTSGAVRMVVDRPCIDIHRQLFCYALTDSMWVLGGAISNGGSVLRWTETVFGDVLDRAANVPAGSDGLVMLPHLLPERAPMWDPSLRGAYLGVQHGHTEAHFVRAAVEGVCMQMRLILDQVDAMAPVDSVRATGGVFRSDLWRNVMAACLDRPLYVVASAEGTALAAAAMGLFAMGEASTLAGAAERLANVDSDPPERIDADATTAATYDRVRASVPDLIGRLEPVAAMFRANQRHHRDREARNQT